MRSSGILLPVASLPSSYGIGCFSESAYAWIDFLERSGQTYWQILPLGPTSYGDSPYQSFSTFAGNPYFVSLTELIRQGLLTKEECEQADLTGHPAYVEYGKLFDNRYPLLRTAYARSAKRADEAFLAFEREQADWLPDFALYMALKYVHDGEPWHTWEEKLRLRDPETLRTYREELADDICFHEYLQYWFYTQWAGVKRYANERGIRIMGDLPIYVAFDSADAWMNPELFYFDEKGFPIEVAGCPPDGFSADGQLWGNPLYRWDYHRETGYAWWISRVSHCRELYDVVRIDHFRGFDEYYAIPYGHENARNGQWRKGPGIEFFEVIRAQVPDLDIVAEDLGYLTDSVRELVKKSGFPGMKVLQFAFGGEVENDYLPHNYSRNAVVYTGTHDNETLMQYLRGLPEYQKQFLADYAGHPGADDGELCASLIRMALGSVADYCIIPIQDYLQLGAEARTNFPSTLGDNWKWRLTKGELTDELAGRIHRLTYLYGRLRK